MAQRITVIRGDTRNIDVAFTDSDGAALDLTGGEVFFTVNPSSAPTDDNEAVISKDITSFTDATGGLCRVALTSNDTDITPGTYYYDVQFVDSSGNVTSKPQDKFIVKADITRRTA